MENILMILRKDANIKKEDFQDSEYNVEIYDDVILGLQKISDIKPQIVVLDMGTERISGIDFLNIIRSNPKYHHMKIIITSKVYNYKYIKQSFESGADFFIQYPIEKQDLKNIYSALKNQDDYYNLEKLAKRHRKSKLQKQQDLFK